LGAVKDEALLSTADEVIEYVHHTNVCNW
jgi:hypothetical protein